MIEVAETAAALSNNTNGEPSKNEDLSVTKGRSVDSEIQTDIIRVCLYDRRLSSEHATYIRTVVLKVDFVLRNLDTVNSKLEWFKAGDARTVQQLPHEFN